MSFSNKCIAHVKFNHGEYLVDLNTCKVLYKHVCLQTFICQTGLLVFQNIDQEFISIDLTQEIEVKI